MFRLEHLDDFAKEFLTDRFRTGNMSSTMPATEGLDVTEHSGSVRDTPLRLGPVLAIAAVSAACG